MRMQSKTRFTGRKFDRWISSFSPPGAYAAAPFFSLSGWYRSQFTKFLITRISLGTPKISTVCSRKVSLTAVIPSDFSMENLVIPKYEGSAPPSVISVQRRDVRQPPHAGHHLLRQHRRDRMRNRVVHVQHVQVVALRHFRHPPGQRQAVRRVLKQGVVRDLHFVIVDARRIRIQADRIRIGNEMDLVPASGQLHSQFGGDNPAAAVGWITSDADVHLASVAKPICPCRFSSGDATSPPPNHTRIRSPSTTTVGSQIAG